MSTFTIDSVTVLIVLKSEWSEARTSLMSGINLAVFFVPSLIDTPSK